MSSFETVTSLDLVPEASLLVLGNPLFAGLAILALIGFGQLRSFRAAKPKARLLLAIGVVVMVVYTGLIMPK